ncbi:uncharacterized protein LOC132637284 [Lycium barbarum]|uniref:uncharacterized protein LOC132637284 n=1 Tax=Lycium barbarum TaxID=112863 RepID=UPI00293ED02F|nr:uncharacterized protein LOC132637284 [Lycium barbarum]
MISGSKSTYSKPTFSAIVQESLHSNQAEHQPVEIKQGTHLGKRVVYFNAEDYFVNLAKECKLTIVGKFIRGKPPMEDIRKSFVSQFQLRRTPKIAYFDPEHVYIDFYNEVDYTHIQSKTYVYIDECPMKVLKWSPDFTPKKETSIVLVWVLIHKLPWHLFKWDILARIIKSVGTAVAPDQATYSKSRGNVAKIKVKIDLLKPRLDQIWLGFNRLEGGEDGVWLDIEYKGVPSYCNYCCIQGHLESQCRKKARDDRIKAQKKEAEEKEKKKLLKTTTHKIKMVSLKLREKTRSNPKRNTIWKPVAANTRKLKTKRTNRNSANN